MTSDGKSFQRGHRLQYVCVFHRVLAKHKDYTKTEIGLLTLSPLAPGIPPVPLSPGIPWRPGGPCAPLGPFGPVAPY